MKFNDCIDALFRGKAKPCQKIKTLTKANLVIRNSTILLCFACISFFGSTLFAQKINVTFKNASLPTIIKEIEKQSSYSFVYTREHVAIMKPVSMHIENSDISSALNLLFKDQRLEYTISNKYIVLKVKKLVEKIENSTPTVEIIRTTEDLYITGTINNDRDLPLEGASVIEKGTQNKTQTNSKGEFKLRLKDNKSILQISYLGYEEQLIVANNSKVMKIILLPTIQKLEDVIVIGYGTKSKKKLTTSISTIKGTDINDLPVGTVGDALAGQAAGLQVSSALGGMPGEPPTIRIRGIGSLGADNEPLYVVDGYPLPSEASFSGINPADIESIEILKDAAAASIYGSRGANGVIIVSTKRGKAGKIVFGASFITGFQQITKKIKLLTTEEYLDYMPLLIKERNSNGGVLNDTLNQLGSTDWQDAIFSSKPYNEFKVSASGGNEKARYSISAGYLNQPGVLLGTGARRYNLRVNVDAVLSPKLKLGINVAPTYLEQDRRPNGGNFNSSIDNEYGVVIPSPIYSALLMPPVIPLVLADGRYGQPNFLKNNSLFNTGYFNPVAVLNGLKNHNTNFSILSNAFLDWAILKNLTFRTNVGGNLTSNRREVYVASTTPTSSSPLASFMQKYPANIAASEGANRGIDWLVENSLTFSKLLAGQHNIKLLLLQSAQKYQSTSTLLVGRQGSFISDQIQNPSAASDHDGSVGYDVYTFSSLVARVNYDFKGKYLLDASVRNDGSSKFGANNKFGTFRSIAVGWRIGEERFVKNKLSFISEWKLTASFGESGNANIGSFSWQSFLDNINYSYANNRQFGTTLSGFYNPNLTWEKNQQINFGSQMGFLKDRLSIAVDIYKKNTTDMILSKQLLSIVGYATAYNKNVGNLENKGLEITISSKNIVGKRFTWSSDFNISFNKNKVIDLGGADNLGYYNSVTGWNNVFLIKVGRPIGDMYGFKVDGILKTQAEAAAYTPYATAPAKAGDMKIKDVDGNGVIDLNDMTKIGNALPKFTMGFTNRFRYKTFDIGFTIQAVVGGDIINGTIRNAWGTAGSNLEHDFYNNIYTKADSLANVKYPSPASVAPYTFANSLTSLALQPASFVRLRNLTIGYNMPSHLLRRIKLLSLRCYLSGQNLFTVTKYPGYNPEVSLTNKSITTPGIDQGVYPQVKNYVAGISIGF